MKSVLRRAAAGAAVIGIVTLAASASTALAAGPVVVSSLPSSGWSAFQTCFDGMGNEIPADPSNTVGIVSGPSGSPTGGSVRMTAGDGTVGGDCEASARNTNFNGVPLANVSSLSYWTYSSMNNGPGGQFPVLRLNVNSSGTGTTSDDVLFFEPPYQSAGNGGVDCASQAPTVMNTWQQWNSTKTNGCWWDNNGVLNPGTGTGTLQDYLAMFPNAKIVNNGSVGGLGVFVGEASPSDQFVGNVAQLSISTTTGGTTTYDFQPPPVTADSCTGVLPPGNYKNVTAFKGCLIDGLDIIKGNVMVQKGGSLQDGDSQNGGAPIGGNLQANNALWIDIGHAGSIGGNLQVQGLTSKPGPGDTTDGATVNDLCNTSVNGDVQVQNNGAGAPFDIGGSPDCGPALTIGGNLQVHDNAGSLSIANNVASKNIQVNKNTGGGTLTNNTAGGNCQLGGDHPPITGSGNSAGAGHQNQCNANA